MKCERPSCDETLSGRQTRWCSNTCQQWGWRHRHDAERRDPDDRLDRIADLLEANGIPLADIGVVKSVSVGEWTALAKGEMVEDPATGRKHREATREVPMSSARIVLHPTWATGPKWQPVDQATPVEVNVPPAKPDYFGGLLRGWKTAVVLPDPQFGFRRDLVTGELDPFHDLRALDIALQVVELERPNLAIWLGDVLDFAPFGRYQQEAAFALTVQPTIDVAYQYVAQVAELSGASRFIQGNHDLRLQNMIIDNAKAAFGIRRAGAPPAEWPVMSVPYLLRFDELGVEYVDGYPAGATYINDNLACIHGHKIGNKTRTAASMVLDDERVSVIYGHVHKLETSHRTRNSRGGPKFSKAHSPGCLCRIDGAVPSVRSGIDAFGRPVKSWEDWQNGLAVVRYQEGDGKFHVEPIEIYEGWAFYGDSEFQAR